MNLEEFLWQFLHPGKYIQDCPSGLGTSLMDHAIRCESVHFLSSAVSGWLVFCLIWTILYPRVSILGDRYIYRLGFVWGLFASYTVHIFIDAFTKIA